MNNRILSLFAAGLIALTGLSFSPIAAADHHSDRDRREVCDYCGTVREISRVNTRTSHNEGAIVAGAVIGGALGNQVGKGDGRTAATVAGAVAGGVIANNATKEKKTSYLISVRMDNGRIYEFQQGSTHGARVGSRVEIQNGRVYPVH